MLSKTGKPEGTNELASGGNTKTSCGANANTTDQLLPFHSQRGSTHTRWRARRAAKLNMTDMTVQSMEKLAITVDVDADARPRSRSDEAGRHVKGLQRQHTAQEFEPRAQERPAIAQPVHCLSRVESV